MINVANSESKTGREGREQSKSRGPETAPAARQTLTGWKAEFLGYMFSVRKAEDSDITEILGKITEAVNNMRVGTLTKIESADEVEKKGEIARAQVSDTTAATRGTVEFTSELFNLINSNLVGTPSPKMFVLEKPQQEFLAWRDKADFTGTGLNRSLILEDIANQPVYKCFMVDREVGGDFQDLFERHEHKVVPLKYGDGFKAEIGGLSLMFLYHDGATPEQDGDQAAAPEPADSIGGVDRPVIH